MLDRYWFGSSERVSPEAPVPVVDVENTQNRLGGAANVAANLAGLGAHVRLVGVAGDDAAGRDLTELTSDLGIDNDLCIDQRVDTTVKQRVISRNQQLMRLDFGAESQTTAAIAAADITERVASALARGAVDAVVCSDYAKGALADIEEIIKCARGRNVPVVVDPKRADWTAYRGADVLTPNAGELAAVSGSVDTACDDSVAQAADAARSRYELGALLVTRSQRGMTLVTADGASHMPACAREVFDVTGAGDTVTALVATGLAQQESLTVAAERANRGAAAVVGRVGTSAPSAAELVAGAYPHVTVDQQAVKLAWIERERAAGQQIVLTNGCFDLLHAGHVDLLRRARVLGDRLVVAINDDTSIARLKGAGRPVHDIATRMTVLEALADVDCVVCFADDTPAALIDAIRPQVLVKGGDYSADDIVGADVVRSGGGRVEILDLLPGYSTTQTLADAPRFSEQR